MRPFSKRRSGVIDLYYHNVNGVVGAHPAGHLSPLRERQFSALPLRRLDRLWVFADIRETKGQREAIGFDHELRGLAVGTLKDWKRFLGLLDELGFRFRHSDSIDVPLANGRKHVIGRDMDGKQIMGFTDAEVGRCRLDLPTRDGLLELHPEPKAHYPVVVDYDHTLKEMIYASGILDIHPLFEKLPEPQWPQKGVHEFDMIPFTMPPRPSVREVRAEYERRGLVYPGLEHYLALAKRYRQHVYDWMVVGFCRDVLRSTVVQAGAILTLNGNQTGIYLGIETGPFRDRYSPPDHGEDFRFWDPQDVEMRFFGLDPQKAS